MNKALMAVLSALFIHVHGMVLLAHAEVQEKHVTTQHLPVYGNYQMAGSMILGSQPDEQDCGEKPENGFFVFKGSIDELDMMNNKVIVVQSWNHLEALKKRTLQSKLLESIKPDALLRHDFAVVMIPFAGLQHIQNEQLVQKNNNLFFSYEIWESPADAIPACLWQKLYVLKFRKRL